MATIEISETTLNRFKSAKGFISDDDSLNQLMDDQAAVEKHIKEYLEGRDECIDEIMLGRHAIANHCFVDDVCTKCGAVYNGVTRV